MSFFRDFCLGRSPAVMKYFSNTVHYIANAGPSHLPRPNENGSEVKSLPLIAGCTGLGFVS
jgi:hypothetical protein